jgi:5-methyltetrahydropteroyltriglutamate--homocysteine methyltransferase
VPASILPTTVVGSYPQPDWLVDREKLKSQSVARVRMKEIWRLPPEVLEQAQDDATIVAIRDMERAGIDIVSDGEIRRESFSNRFSTALDGIDIDNPLRVTMPNGRESIVPRVVGKIRRRHAVEVRDVEFLRRNTDRRIKITLPGPFTIAQQCQNEFYADDEELTMDLAAALNEEARDLQAAGADVIQIDEPLLRTNLDAARRYAVKAIDRALSGLEAQTVVHLCFGYAHLVSGKPSGYAFLPELADSAAQQISIEAAQPRLDLGVLKDLGNKTVILGVVDLGTSEVESADTVAARIRDGLKYVSPERLIPAPDCGMKYMARETAFGKLKAISEGAAIVRAELS